MTEPVICEHCKTPMREFSRNEMTVGYICHCLIISKKSEQPTYKIVHSASVYSGNK